LYVAKHSSAFPVSFAHPITFVVRPSIAEPDFLRATCGVTRALCQPLTKSVVSYALSAPNVAPGLQCNGYRTPQQVRDEWSRKQEMAS